MHARKTARDAFFPSRDDDVFFSPRRGDIVFPDGGAVRTFAERVNRGEGRPPQAEIRPAELAAMALVHEVLHAVIGTYRERHPESFARLGSALEGSLGPRAKGVTLEFLAAFPPPAVYRTLRGEGDVTPARHLEQVGPSASVEIDEELLLLWVTNQNPAYDPVRTIVTDHDLGSTYQAFIDTARRVFADEPEFGPRGETLVDLLLAPGRAHPTSIFAQLEYIDVAWGQALGLDKLPFWRRLAWAKDLRAEEGKWFQKGGPGPGDPLLEAMQFGRKDDEETARFSPDLGWMPNVVLIAKSVYVWLDQLGKKYGRDIRRLDHVPDEELDRLASSGMNGLWLIGLFERSHASRRVKQMRGDHDALASAYSLKGYDIAEELGGVSAYDDLSRRARARGIRLAADMVPNHVGIDGDWVIQHPDWFLQTRTPPFPGYRFGGPDLSDDPRVGVFLEEGYWNKTDAAVVFRRHDRWTGEDRFIYHGNDGTSMPWNDTAQLDYLRADVRHAVIETILHVARMFPIIRFDAAMTLAKRHIQRLWYPLPGQGGAIPSRSDYALTQEEFDRIIPVEFWREVVDTVAERAPDTLLLAEAFWMMEGYFVRTLGMHRVYNSAFMNMLKREENEKYRATIKNVLDFDAEILKRFVNFMNNPDEETAAVQFGDDDKYFGVCVLMSTMPGLPMFGHGQIEGLREKYGMEYRRARYDEQPKEHMIQRHEREIFPILRKRYLFSGVEHFALYDFVTEGGHVDEDVYAYSNGAGSERALVVFNNKWKTTRGRIFGSTHRGQVGHELAIDPSRGEWLVIRDIAHGREYLRPSWDLVNGGLVWELDAFKYHVLSDFRPVTATREKPYDRLAAELAGRGVPDIEYAVRELYLRPVHAPLREACSKGHIGYLASQLTTDSDVAARAAFEERLGHVADGLDWLLSQRTGRDVTVDRKAALRGAGDRFAALHAVLRASAKTSASAAAKSASGVASGSAAADVSKPAALAVDGVTTNGVHGTTAEAAGDGNELHVDWLLALIQVEAVLDLLEGVERASEASLTRAATSSETERTVETEDEVVTERDPMAYPDLDTTAPATEVESKGAAGPASPSSVTNQRANATATPAVTATPTGTSATPSAKAAPAAPSASSESVSSDASGTVPSVSAGRWSAREALLTEWDLTTPVLEGLATMLEPDEARRLTALAMLAATLPTGALAPSIRLALETKRGQTFMNVHEADGTIWLNKERFEDLARFLAEREAASGRALYEATQLEAKALAQLAEREGYRAERIAAKLGPAPKVEPGVESGPADPRGPTVSAREGAPQAR
ncbi:MAG TPA: alpha-amylase family glycosyl hydrolase [Labilithrix sp.]|nr:alpha-amylase family glycosyl hydrolase [Labilithrix sp.]